MIAPGQDVERYSEDIQQIAGKFEMTITIRCDDSFQLREVSNALAKVGRAQHPYKRFAWVSVVKRLVQGE